jgi:hypothetical protein
MGNNMLWIADHIEFSLYNAYTASYNGMPIPGFCYGMTRGLRNTMNNKAEINIGYELVQLLLRDDSEYIDAERIVDNFRLATTMLHETTVRRVFVFLNLMALYR